MSEFQQALDDMASILDKENKQEIIVDEEELETPDVEISDGTLSPIATGNHSQENQQRNPQPQKKKHDNTFKKRIADITAAKYEREQQLLVKEQENNYLRELLAQRDVELTQKEDYAHQQFEGNLQAREIAIRNELINAKEEGDHTREVELENALFDIKAQKHTNDLYKHQIRQKPQSPQYEPAYNQQQAQNYQQPPQVNEDYMDWVEENSWVNPQDPNFDPDLQQEAINISTELERGLKLKKQAHLIGTREFYDTISRVIEERYGLQPSEEEAYEEPQAPAPVQRAQSSSSYQVAPVNQGGGTMSHQYNYPKNQPQQVRMPGAQAPIRMTREQYEVARNLQIKDPLTGQAINDVNERLKRYAAGMKHPPSPPKPGYSSPYRFTAL